MNNAHVVSWANALAAMVDEENLDVSITEIYQRTLGRAPAAAELATNRAFLDAQVASYEGGNARQLALADLCQVVFGLNEFVYIQ